MSLIKDPVILNFEDMSKDAIEKHRKSLADYYKLFLRAPSINGKIKIHDHYSILWDNVKYEFEDYQTSLTGISLRYIELFRRDYTKHSISYYNTNNELITQIIWWPNGIVKNISSFDGNLYCESAYHQNSKYDYTLSYRITDYSSQIYCKFI